MHKVVFDAALQDGHTVWCLPPGENRQSWGMSLLDLGLFAQGCGQTGAIWLTFSLTISAHLAHVLLTFGSGGH